MTKTHFAPPYKLAGTMNGKDLYLIRAGLNEMDEAVAVNGGPGFIGKFTTPNIGMVEAENPSEEYLTAIYVCNASNMYDGLLRAKAAADKRIAELTAMLTAIADEFEDVIDTHIYDVGEEPADAPERKLVNDARAIIKGVGSASVIPRALHRAIDDIEQFISDVMQAEEAGDLTSQSDEGREALLALANGADRLSSEFRKVVASPTAAAA